MSRLLWTWGEGEYVWDDDDHDDDDQREEEVSHPNEPETDPFDDG